MRLFLSFALLLIATALWSTGAGMRHILADERGAIARVAYVHAPGASPGFDRLLGDRGFQVDLFDVETVDSEVLAAYDAVLVGPDTDEMWETYADEAAVIEASGRDIIGIGEGGYDFFGALELEIGQPYGAHSDGDTILAENPDNALYDAPHPVTLVDGTLRLSQQLVDFAEINLSNPAVTHATVVARNPNDPNYARLIRLDEEGRCYHLWGFSGAPDQFTHEGADLLANVLVSCGVRAPVRLDIFEGWNGIPDWEGRDLESVEEILEALSASVEPDVWESVALFSGEGWLQSFADAPLPSFNTLPAVSQGSAPWLFVTGDTSFAFPR
jgi:hypothetical protein